MTNSNCGYVAPELKDFTVLGVPVQAFIDETGEIVFSESAVEKALGLEAGEAQEILRRINSQS